MAYKTYPITGIKQGWGPDNQVPLRRDFNEWSESTNQIDQDQLGLFVLALLRFQEIDPNDRDSYFQIAGIHGMPYKSWDEPDTTTDEVGVKGYCAHANNLFPPWHRPYLLLYEQRIYEIMVNEIVPEQSKDFQGRLLDAAHSWRLPYWDWAKNPRIPRWFRSPVFTPPRWGGPSISKKLPNPLYKFKMPHGKKMAAYGVGSLATEDGKLEYGECYATSRCPSAEERKGNSQSWKDGVVNSGVSDELMIEHSAVNDKDYGTSAEMVYRLLTYEMEYPHFATVARDTKEPSKVTNDVNLEFMHNNIHYWVGGDGGHMAQIPVATFDPIFWFHHCHLDRLFAIWQTLNPGKWFYGDMQRPFDQRTIGAGDVVSNKSPLRPFHKDTNGTVWMPEDTLDWFRLGYTYPELQRWRPEFQSNGVFDKDKYTTKLLESINESYGITRKEALQMVESGAAIPGIEIKDEGSVEANDYAISIRYAKFAFGGHPFNLEVYLRPQGQEKTFEPEHFVTNVYNFSQPATGDDQEVCTNCRQLEDQNVQVTAYIPLTSYLIRMIKEERLQSLEKVYVEDLLKGLYWRVTRVGSTVPEERWRDSMNLNAEVSVTKMTYTKDAGIKPTFEDPEVIPDLGTQAGETEIKTPGVSATEVPLHGIVKLGEQVPAGGSIVAKSPYMNEPDPDAPTVTGISLMYLDESSGADTHDRENYDISLNLAIRPDIGLIIGSSKAAGHGFTGEDEEIAVDPWFQKESPQIRVDVRQNDFELLVDGRNVGRLTRAFKDKEITHVSYWTIPEENEPVMDRRIEVTAYTSAGLVGVT